MNIRIRNTARRLGLPLAAALLTAGAVLVSACGSSNEGTPPPVANFVTDNPAPAPGEVTLQRGFSSGTTADLQVRVQGPVAGIMAANFDLLFQTFRCQDILGGPGTQNTCFTDTDCLAGESCKQSGNLVARFVFATPANLLDCGLPGTLNPLLLPSPLVPERLIIGLTRINFRACSSNIDCSLSGDIGCLPTGELCGAVGRCVKPASDCRTGCPLLTPTCVEQACDAVGNDLLLTLTFEILDRGSIRVEFADTLSAIPMPPTLEDLNGNPIAGVFFPAGSGGILQGL